MKRKIHKADKVNGHELISVSAPFHLLLNGEGWGLDYRDLQWAYYQLLPQRRMPGLRWIYWSVYLFGWNVPVVGAERNNGLSKGGLEIGLGVVVEAIAHGNRLFHLVGPDLNLIV